MAQSKCGGPSLWFLKDVMDKEVARQAGLLKHARSSIQKTQNGEQNDGGFPG
jgi:hypothetical protein